MTLPLLVSVPHAGLAIPPEAGPYCILTEEEIIRDGDEGAAAVYRPLEREVAAFVTTSIARAIVDMNRAEDDRRKDGVVKTHTCWDVPVYREPLPEDVVQRILERYHRPYHRSLTARAGEGILLGLDCHTMAATGPPVGPDPGRERPAICLGSGDGSIPRDSLETLAACLEGTFERRVSIDDPFTGGHIVRAHGREIPWVQVEMSRAPFLPAVEKTRRILSALAEWVHRED
jgi:formiminoglutamase